MTLIFIGVEMEIPIDETKRLLVKRTKEEDKMIKRVMERARQKGFANKLPNYTKMKKYC